MTDPVERLSTDLAGRYRIERELGRGGMATVYLAQDVKHHRPVAIKVLRPELAASLAATRFLREIEIAARLRHPHILPLYDSGEAAGSFHYVMPYVDGESLRERLERETQLPVEDALRIAVEVADALRYAHGHDVVHRDIKPENILLDSGHAVVADFGIARAVTAARDEKLTGTGLAIGTPAYMSIEQATGDDGIDARSDIYSLGCVLYEMLAGEPPFTGPTVHAIIARHAAEPVPRLRVIRDAVPEWLEAVVTRALAKAPADRFGSAAELIKALRTRAADGTAERKPIPAAHSGNTIAVLPFANLGGDPDDEFLSDGLSDELIHALAKVDGLRVVARTSAFAFKGRHEDVRLIGERLNVRTVLEGSVRRSGNRVRIGAHLVNAVDGYELWSERYDRRLDDVLAVQDEIARTIARVLEARLLARPDRTLPGAAQGDPKAHRLCMRGRHHWNRRTHVEVLKAIDCFEQAVRIDPAFAPAHAGLADAYVILGMYGLLAPEAAMPKAKAAARRALEIDDRLPEAFASRACVLAMHEWDWSRADSDFRRALEAGPNYAVAHHWYAITLLAPLGRFDEAAEEFRKAHELDPLSPVINATAGVLSFFARDYDRAVTVLHDALELDPNFWMAHFFLGQSYVEEERYDDAVAALREAVRLADGSAETVAALGYACGVAGRRGEAAEALEELETRAKRSYVSPILRAQVATGLGDRDRALDLLEEAVARHAADAVWLKVRPTFDVLRDEPRFARLLARLGFP